MISVVIADDRHVVREGIALVLQQEGDINVVGQASNGEEAVTMIMQLNPDVTILDISMPKLNGIQTAQKLIRDGFKGKILMLTQYDKEEYVREAIQTGASGYLLKDSIKDEVITAIRKIMSGETFFSPSISKLLVDEYFQQLKRKTVSKSNPDLTPRETEVLQLIAEGYSTKQIADKLYLSARTVDFHRANISQKLGVHDIAGLTKYAIRHGLVKV